MLLNLRQYQEQVDLMRDIIKDTFALGDDDEDEEEDEPEEDVGHLLGSLFNGNHQESKKKDKEKAEMDLSAVLCHLRRPEHQRGSSQFTNRGFRLIDLRLLKIALEKAQACGCAKNGGRISLAEVQPDRVQEDLATHLSLTCSSCGKATVFATSAFCEKYPANYKVNKDLLQLLGTEAYFKLANYVQASFCISLTFCGLFPN